MVEYVVDANVDVVVVDGIAVVAEVVSGVTTAMPSTTTTSTLASTTYSTITTEPLRLPCPVSYDYIKTTYVDGEQIEIKEHTFQCNEEEGCGMYCTLAGWDDHYWIRIRLRTDVERCT